MKRHSNESGFSALEVILIIVVVGVIAGAGWFVWHKSQSSKTASSDTSQQTTAEQTSTADATDESTLTISEWGIKVTVPDSLKGATYAIKDDVAEIDSPAQDAVTTCGTQVNPKTAWGIQRYAAGKVTAADGSAISDADAEKNSALKHIGDYFYKRVYPMAGCEVASDQTSAIDTAQTSLFESLVKE